MNYCIFGGSFDPPHEGHRHLAQSARNALGLDRVIWVPAPNPPHKRTPATPFHHRLAMVRLAIDGMSGQDASDIEARLPTPSYSIETIKALKAEHQTGHRWFFLIGADNWSIFPRWHRPDDILREVTLVVYPRAGHALQDLPTGVLRLDLPEVPAESTRIRERLVNEAGERLAGEAGENPAAAAKFEAAGVLPELRDYIAANGLYGFPGKLS